VHGHDAPNRVAHIFAGTYSTADGIVAASGHLSASAFAFNHEYFFGKAVVFDDENLPGNVLVAGFAITSAGAFVFAVGAFVGTALGRECEHIFAAVAFTELEFISEIAVFLVALAEALDRANPVFFDRMFSTGLLRICDH